MLVRLPTQEEKNQFKEEEEQDSHYVTIMAWHKRLECPERCVVLRNGLTEKNIITVLFHEELHHVLRILGEEDKIDSWLLRDGATHEQTIKFRKSIEHPVLFKFGQLKTPIAMGGLFAILTWFAFQTKNPIPLLVIFIIVYVFIYALSKVVPW